MIICANLKQVMAMKHAFIARWRVKQLREDYEKATRHKNIKR